MHDYRVQLDVYHGPLDLLLYLIKRDEIDIHDIPIARITDQYLQHVRTLRSLDINLAGEFLVMAATLMEIKSAMLSPPRAADDGADPEALTAAADSTDPADPRFELVRQLLAYKRFKDAAAALERRREDFAARFPRRPAPFDPAPARPPSTEGQAPDGIGGDEEAAPPDLDLEDVSVWDLLEAFSTLMEQVGGPPRVELVQDDTPMELHAADILDRLQRDGPTTLQDMFAARHLAEMIGLFLALLELLRQRKVRAAQDRPGGAIRLEPRPQSDWVRPDAEAEAEDPAWDHDPNNPDNFDWPDEPARRRYERRIERRRKGQVIVEDEEFEADVRAIEAEENTVVDDASRESNHSPA